MWLFTPWQDGGIVDACLGAECDIYSVYIFELMEGLVFRRSDPKALGFSWNMDGYVCMLFEVSAMDSFFHSPSL